MAIELRIPSAGESILEVQIGEWLKQEGEAVGRDEVVVAIETDKASMELTAPAAGRLAKILKQAGEAAKVGEVIGLIEEGAAAEQGATAGRPRGAEGESPGKKAQKEKEGPEGQDTPASAGQEGAGAEPETAGVAPAGGTDATRATGDTAAGSPARIMPAARRALHESGLEAAEVAASGPGGRLLKEDVARAAQTGTRPAPAGEGQPTAVAAQPASARAQPASSKAQPASAKAQPASTMAQPASAKAQPPAVTAQRRSTGASGREEELVPMSLIRKRIAARLVEAKREAALLTTFNEIDMSAVKALRQEHRAAFEERYQVRLGFMSFFVKAVIDGLKREPALNAEIRGESIAYRNYYDIGVAVGSGRGLVVPVLRDADRMSFADVERAIADIARRAEEGKLSVEELHGGTFTISNGGVYGSLLSTPIVNYPQSGILGMHAIQERPIAVEGQVVVRPMMYVALTYDHRVIDGREAVTFLLRVKEAIEDPARILLEV